MWNICKLLVSFLLFVGLIEYSRIDEDTIGNKKRSTTLICKIKLKLVVPKLFVIRDMKEVKGRNIFIWIRDGKMKEYENTDCMERDPFTEVVRDLTGGHHFLKDNFECLYK